MKEEKGNMQKNHPWFSNAILFILSFILLIALIGTSSNSIFRPFSEASYQKALRYPIYAIV